MKSVTRAFALVELFATHATPLNVTDAARMMDIPISTCFNLMRALLEAGYLYEVNKKCFYPTSRLLEQAQVISESDPIRAMVKPLLIMLRDQTQETIMLTKRAGDRALILDVVMGPQTIRYTANVGDFRPLYNSAMGKALLGSLSEEVRLKTVSTLKFRPVTKKTLTNVKALLKDIEEGVKRGWFSTEGEGVIDVMSIARPLVIGGSSYAIAVAGPLERMRPMQRQIAVKLVTVCERARKLSCPDM